MKRYRVTYTTPKNGGGWVEVWADNETEALTRVQKLHARAVYHAGLKTALTKKERDRIQYVHVAEV